MHYVAEDDLKLPVLLLLPPKMLGYSCFLSCLVLLYYFYVLNCGFII